MIQNLGGLILKLQDLEQRLADADQRIEDVTWGLVGVYDLKDELKILKEIIEDLEGQRRGQRR